MTATVSPHDLQLLLNAEHPNPFGFLGLQEANGQLVVRAFRPDAKSLTIVDRNDQKRRFPGEKLLKKVSSKRDWQGLSRGLITCSKSSAGPVNDSRSPIHIRSELFWANWTCIFFAKGITMRFTKN